jgi:2-polyprenyl-3-methyl-5-hydroxy-6-metoxy-1,4-benzoquinol methylase
VSLEGSTQYWLEYYKGVHGAAAGHLDYSNERVQMQSFGFALDAAGPLSGRRCLDVGAGKGQLARMMLAAGASSVTAIEVIAATVDDLRKWHPEIDWRAGDAGDPASYASMSPFDVVVALEVLQYVPFEATVAKLFSLTLPGGRLVGVIPNRDCPLAQKSMERFEGHFGAVSAAKIARVLGGLPDVELWGHRGLHFQADQRIAPYHGSPWSTVPTHDTPPNRFVFVARRRGGTS